MNDRDDNEWDIASLYRGDIPLSSLDVQDFLEAQSTYTCLAFDPGGTTGWALFNVHLIALTSDKYKILENIVLWSAGEFKGSEKDIAYDMLWLARAWPYAAIVLEDFILRRFDMNRALLSPVRITARFEQGLAMAGDERADKIIFQQPALALGTVHDERLRNWGFWNITRGKPHARDAIRHALTALRRAKETLRTVPSENENENDCH